MNPPVLFLLGLALSSLLMTGSWVLARHLQNLGLVRLAWALGFTLLALLDRIFADGEPIRQNLITLMVMIWSLRLGGLLWQRQQGDFSTEDGRYQELRRSVAGHENFFFFWYFQSQGVLLTLLSLPMLLVNFDARVGLCFSDKIGFLVWLVAIAGEWMADSQLAAFKAVPSNRGKVCSSGLWHYSRHPNYFFECLVWMAFFLFAAPSSGGVLMIFAPVLILVLLLRRGIPAAEAQALHSRGAAYRVYQRTTHAFVPWFQRKNRA